MDAVVLAESVVLQERLHARRALKQVTRESKLLRAAHIRFRVVDKDRRCGFDSGRAQRCLVDRGARLFAAHISGVDDVIECVLRPDGGEVLG